MTRFVVAFSKIEDAKRIKSILIRSGFSVIALCTTASQVLSTCEEWDSGILVCGCRFADMMYEELRECLPPSVEMLLISSPNHWVSPVPKGCVCLPMPLKVHDLISTLEMMSRAQVRQKKSLKTQPRKRSDEEKGFIEKAKKVLMERNNMTESEAHRYIQKCSMDTGTNMVETAQMILQIM